MTSRGSESFFKVFGLVWLASGTILSTSAAWVMGRAVLTEDRSVGIYLVPVTILPLGVAMLRTGHAILTGRRTATGTLITVTIALLLLGWVSAGWVSAELWSGPFSVIFLALILLFASATGCGIFLMASRELREEWNQRLPLRGALFYTVGVIVLLGGFSLVHDWWQGHVSAQRDEYWQEIERRPRLTYVGFSPLPPAEKLECRLAIAYALDREAIIRAVKSQSPWLWERATPAYSIQSPRLPEYHSSIRWPTSAPSKARTLWRQCGWQKPLVITIGDLNDLALPWAVRDSLRRVLGVPVTISRVDEDTLLTQVRMRRVAIFIRTWRADPGDYGFPSMPLGLAARYFMHDPKVATLTRKRDGPATERTLLQRMWVIPSYVPSPSD